ncbi:MAG: acyl carrier protein [Alphaproteobacteria bacterium]|nr:acyl carrier protein [Alphaproteobacteria bacterium]
MTRTEMEARVRELLVDLAPEFEADAIDPDEDLRQQLDIDSMDLHQLATSLFEVYGVDIPESERADLVTLRAIVDWLDAHVSR